MLFGTVSTSIPQIILLANWLFEGNYKEKFKTLKGHKIFWILSAVFLMHVLGLIHTAYMEAGLSDIRIKIPLILLPLIFFSTKPLNKKELNLLLGLFVTGIVLSSFWCMYYYYSHVIIDMRKVSRFMSHIRFGLFINLGICTLVYFIITSVKNAVKIVSGLIMVYLFWFMFNFGLVTGLVMFGFVAAVYSVLLIIKQNIKIKLIGLLVILTGACAGFWFVDVEWKASNYVDASKANIAGQKSAAGRSYYKISDNLHTENGFYVANNIQYDELFNGWPAISRLSVYADDKRGNPVIWTLIRYMTSKGFTKDSVGLTQLTKEDVLCIENGITNYKYADASALRKRVKEFLWEYQAYKNGANPSGNTLLMRFEFWKASLYIIKRNVWTGVGTGDAQMAFHKTYNRTNTKLSLDWRLRSHNQFLAITVCFGILGLIVFVFSLFYPVISLRKKVSGLYLAFLFIAVTSFLTEDTLESQSGVSFYAYFNTLFLWLAYENKNGNNYNQNL